MSNWRDKRKTHVGKICVSVLGLALLAGCPTGPPPLSNGNDNDNANGNVNANDNGGANDNDNINDNDNDNGGGSVASKYVGSSRCGDCHGSKYEDFMETGHPFKLNAVVDGTPPEYPVTQLAGPPEGVDWSDVSFVIGGFRYKYRVVDDEGFIVLGPTAQFNFPTGTFSGYSNDDDHTAPDGTPGPWASNIGRKPYNCGRCHTTGYDPDTENRRGLAGLVGDWEFEGVQCEACHGPGADHVASIMAGDLDGARAAINGEPETDETCGSCHTRSADGIAASGGFVRHHEQWDEFSRSRHASVMPNGCMTCHDPHKPIFDATRLAGIEALADADGNDTTLDTLPPPPGIIAECTDCHGQTVNHAGPNTCRTCHMAFTTKSAVATGPNSGDIRSHAWLINTDPDAPSFTNADGVPVSRDAPDANFSALNEDGRPYVTLDFSCLRCHSDKDKQWAADHAADIHG